jgi:hypothetical protein
LGRAVSIQGGEPVSLRAWPGLPLDPSWDGKFDQKSGSLRGRVLVALAAGWAGWFVSGRGPVGRDPRPLLLARSLGGKLGRCLAAPRGVKIPEPRVT